MSRRIQSHLMKGILLAAMVAAAPALASDRPARHRRSIPEFDPATVGTIAALLAGGGILLAKKRR